MLQIHWHSKTWFKLRFKGFDDEWVIKRLDEISEINPKTRELPENFVYIDLDSVNNGILTKFNKINKIDAPSRAQRCLDLNDILFQTVRPYQMNNFFFELNDCDYVASTGYAQIKSQIFPRFLYYYLHYYKFVNDVLNRCTGSSYPAINSTDLKKIKIKIPSSFNEQKLIGDLFHKIDKKIELLENKYEYYQYFKKYLMQQIFTQKLRFDDNCQYKTKQVKDFLIESKIEGIDDINKRLTVKLNLNGITVRESKTIEIEGATKQFIRKTGQFIYGKQNLHKGAFGIIPKELDGYLTSSDIPSFDFKGGIEPKWFYYYFARKSFYEKLENLSTGTGSKRISPKEFLNIKIIVPEFKEQHKIVCLFEKFDEKINGISNQIVQMNMFKKSLLQQMFVVRINWRCNFKLAKSSSFNKHLLILKNKIIFIIIK